jgi:hypothetical protein
MCICTHAYGECKECEDASSPMRGDVTPAETTCVSVDCASATCVRGCAGESGGDLFTYSAGTTDEEDPVDCTDKPCDRIFAGVSGPGVLDARVFAGVSEAGVLGGSVDCDNST